MQSVLQRLKVHVLNALWEQMLEDYLSPAGG